MNELSEADMAAIDEAFQELRTAVAHLDAVEEYAPLFGRVKQELQSAGRLSDETRAVFIDRIAALYSQARDEREALVEALNDAEADADPEAAEEADAYHRDAATLLNAVSMLCFIDPDADRETIMDRIEDASPGPA